MKVSVCSGVPLSLSSSHKTEMFTIASEEEMLSGMVLKVKEFAIPAGKSSDLVILIRTLKILNLIFPNLLMALPSQPEQQNVQD